MKEVTRHITHPVQCLLWGRAAGRCQFQGCNQPLWRSHVTGEQVNIAEKAHIYSFSGEGPRGHDDVSADELNAVANLMLVCHACHRTIDAKADGGRYTAPILQGWKRQHESRVERVTSIHPERPSHVAHYAANIGEQPATLSRSVTFDALFPDRYPASDEPIVLGVSSSAVRDRDAEFWAAESKSLGRKFQERLKPRIEEGEIRHVSLFALAPQPLLMLLGTLLTDLVEVDVFAHHKEPEGWRWQDTASPLEFLVTAPAETDGDPALILSVSGTVTNDRITRAVGNETAIWRLDVDCPHNDCLKTRAQLSAFRSVIRKLLNDIKARHGEKRTLRIFPALPAAMAVELGRVRSPKADMPWQIFDQHAGLGGFFSAISIP